MSELLNQKRLPSEEMAWLKWHMDGARENSIRPIENISVWHFIERKLKEQGDKYPALVYFGKKVSRSSFIEKVYVWARTFKGMGVGVDERVIIYTPFTPEIAYIILALDHIGAWPILLNMSSSPEALTAGAKEARFAVTTDAVEKNVAHIFRGSKAFERVVLLKVSTDMPFPLGAITSLRTCSSTSKLLKENPNYILAKDAVSRWSGYDGEVEAEYDPQRPAIVTSSAGTSNAGYAKQIMDTNSAVIGMFQQVNLTYLPQCFKEGSIFYTGLPPFISTCIFVLFLGPLYYNSTCYIEPRFNQKVFYRNIMKFRPQVCLTTGRCWVYFFTQIERMLKYGKKPDLSFFSFPVMGGEGVIPEDLKWMNSLLKRCGSKVGLRSGYGMSEVFSLLTVDCRDGYAASDDKQPVVSVGVPMPGMKIATFDAEGNELTYGQRGEICAQGVTLMKGYYNDAAHTEAAMRGGWFHSGDLGYIDEDGQLYVYGRMSDAFIVSNDIAFYPADIELKMNEDDEVHSTMINKMGEKNGKPILAAHLVLHHDCRDCDAVIRRLDKKIAPFLPEGVRIDGYKIHRHIFRMNSVCKTDRKSYVAERTGYVRPEGNLMVKVAFN